MNQTSKKTSIVVLVIDDEPQIRRLLRVTLEANGYKVFAAETGNDGIVQAAQCQPQSAETVFRAGKIEVDLSARIVRKNGQEVKLTPTEYSLLRLFIAHAGKVLTHRQLLSEVWGADSGGSNT